MKKAFRLVCCLLVVGLLLFLNVGCSNEVGQEQEPEEETAEAKFPDPSKTLLQLVGYAAGGGFDTYARYIGEHLSDELGITVVTENRTGASGIIPVRDVLNAEPDGYTLLHVHSSAYPIQQALYDTGIKMEDLTYLGGVRKIGYILVASKDSGIEKVEDLIGKNNIVVGMPSTGHICEVAIKTFADVAGFTYKVIPYNGMNEVNAAMLSGEVDLALHSAMMYENNKELISGLAVFSDERLEFYPDMPTIGELGYEDIFLPIDLQGYAGPPGMDEETAETLRSAIKAVTERKEAKDWALNQCEVLKFIPPEEFKRSTLNILDIATEYDYILLGE